jgi:hypothetical protein
LRRIIIIGTALAVLVTAGVALAANLNTYGAGFKFAPLGAGSTHKPKNIGFNEMLSAGGVGGNRAAPLVDIRTTIYGIKSNGGLFPKCTAAIITRDHTKWDANCPKGSLVAQGPVNAILGASITPSAAGSPCNPYLHVYNSGAGKLTFFFVIFGKYQCAGLKTGASAPYPGTIREVGNTMITDVPLPPDVSTEAGGLKGIYAALIKENLTWFNLTKKVGRKTVGINQSFKCVGHKRPWTVAFTAQKFPTQAGPNTVTQKVAGSSAC